MSLAVFISSWYSRKRRVSDARDLEGKCRKNKIGIPSKMDRFGYQYREYIVDQIGLGMRLGKDLHSSGPSRTRLPAGTELVHNLSLEEPELYSLPHPSPPMSPPITTHVTTHLATAPSMSSTSDGPKPSKLNPGDT
jgi:hypothetical protein